MLNTFSHSVQLMKESWNVLKQDKEIIWFPILSGILTIILFASFVIPLALLGIGSEVQSGAEVSAGLFDAAFYLVLFGFYLLSYFIVIFFNTALIACADHRLQGGDPTVKFGLKKALDHIGQIFIWALISATVGLILRLIVDKIQESEKLGIVGKIIGTLIISIIGMAWSFLTFFVIPVMIFENKGVFQSIKQSGHLFKKTWGENVFTQFSLGVIFFLLSLIGVGFIFLGILTGSLPVIITLSIVAVIYWILLGILSSSLNGIFIAALYHYSKTGKVPSGFSNDTIQHAFAGKSKSGLGLF